MNKPNVLFYFHAPHYYRNNLPVIERLVHIGCKVFIISNHKTYYEDKKNNSYIKTNEHVNYLKDVRHNYLKKIPYFGKYIFYIFHKKWIFRIFKNNNIEKLVLSDDRGVYSCIIIKESKKLDIKIIILPVESLQSRKSRTYVRLQQKAFYENNYWHTLIKRFYPKNYEIASGKSVYWYPIKNLICLLLFGSIPMDPWVRGTNKVDCVATSSNSQYDENRRWGIRDSSQFVTGFPMHDRLVKCMNHKENSKTEFSKNYAIDLKKKNFLIVGTTYKQLFGNSNLGKYYKETKQCISIIINKFSNKYNIIYKLHPREKFDHHRTILGSDLVEKLCFIDGKEDIYPWISISDFIFIFISSTVIGSLALDCPIVCYNLGKIKHFEPYYQPFKSLYKAQSIQELESAFAQQIQDDRITKNRQIDRHKFSFFDGNSTDKLC